MQRITKAWARRRKAAGLRKVLRCGMASWKIIGERLRPDAGIWSFEHFHLRKTRKKKGGLFVGKSATSKLARRAGRSSRHAVGGFECDSTRRSPNEGHQGRGPVSTAVCSPVIINGRATGVNRIWGAMMNVGRRHLVVLVVVLGSMTTVNVRAEDPSAKRSWEWTAASPESQGMNSTGLESAWAVLKGRQTTALLVVRHDRIVFERYAPGYGRTKPHYTASMAKALVGGFGLMLAMGDGRIRPDDPASQYVPPWRDDPRRNAITVRHLASHTSGIEDAEADGLPHDRLAGWKGDFWKRLPPPHDPFTLARDRAPVLDVPGTKERYSNPGMAMLGYCVAASLRGTDDADLRSLLKRRIMAPLGVPDSEWSVGYGTVTTVDGLPLVATWGGGSYSPNAVARVGRLLLHPGEVGRPRRGFARPW